MELDLYPGMTETLLVRFRPSEWRYYFEEVKFVTNFGDFLVLPVHGYPAPTSLTFPKFINFGIRPLNSVYADPSVTKIWPDHLVRRKRWSCSQIAP